MSPLLTKAEDLAPLFRDAARESEIARRPADRVSQAVADSGLYAMMVPKAFGGYEEDLDVFFESVLTLARGDASLAWLTGFLIEHNLWLLNYPDAVCEQVFGEKNYALAPATLNVGAGAATPVQGGYRLSGQWQWGTGILHSSWVLAGGMSVVNEQPSPTFFLLPIEDVEPIDTWFMTGMCATGSWDFKVDDVFVPQERALPFMSILENTTGIADRFDGPLFRTPLMPVLGFAAGLPILGAAQGALADFSQQTSTKIQQKALRAGTPLVDVSNLIGEVSLELEAAELMMRHVLADVMTQRNQASPGTKSRWLSQQAYAAHSCKEAVLRIAEATGASGGHLDNPIQRAVRDVSIACNHVVFAKESRYGDIGRALLAS